MKDYQPISCDLYDWLEIAARWQLAVGLGTRDGRQWVDKIHTITARDGVEYLVLHSGERLSLVELATLSLNWQGEEKRIRFATAD
ncbi:Rho-binding antiterminator [Aeromonas encheleia]|uniref:Rho-binding antiterminator n=1 Tax=Aeromonas encheleia TaxID=73010 RepID=UPI001F563E63|nr:Rho-binding antiterminator [Aeromonas encheleia]UNP88565.1 Rho-binding antiterminator [Aeromonas encheleia]